MFSLTICFCVLGKIDKVAGSMANLWGYLVMQMIMFCYHQHLMAYKICLWAYGVVVSMFDFHRSDRGSNPGRGGEIS